MASSAFDNFCLHFADRPRPKLNTGGGVCAYGHLFIDLSCYGHAIPVADGTAELIKKLGVNLYAWKAEGAYLTFPKRRDKGDNRRGKIHSSVKLLLTADEVPEKSVDEIRNITAEAICNDDELAMAGVEYKCDDIARGVDRILYKCPRCLEEGTITAGGGHIKCTCGFDATLDSYYRLHDAPFERVNEWFEWQQASIDTEHEHIATKAKLGCCGKDGFMDPEAGYGEVYLDKDIFKLSGTLHGEKIEFTMRPEQITAFPTIPGEHIDVYHKGNLIYIYPEDAQMTVKWVSFLDNLMAKQKTPKKRQCRKKKRQNLTRVGTNSCFLHFLPNLIKQIHNILGRFVKQYLQKRPILQVNKRQ